MNTLYIIGNKSELREAARLKGIINVKIGRIYSNRKGEVIKIAGETTVPGWSTPFFVDTLGRRYDQSGFCYDAEKFPYSKYDLVKLTTKLKLKRVLKRYSRASKKTLILSLVSTVQQLGSKIGTNLKSRNNRNYTRLSFPR